MGIRVKEWTRIDGTIPQVRETFIYGWNDTRYLFYIICLIIGFVAGYYAGY